MAPESKNLAGISRDALQSFYMPPPDDLPKNARKLLEDYSKIPSEEVLSHVVQVVCAQHCWPDVVKRNLTQLVER
jgi:hypothetical protein